MIAYSLTFTSSRADADARGSKVTALEKAGHPVVRIAMADIYDLGAGVLPLGNCDGGCRFHHRDQCFQSAGCGSQQDRHAEADFANTKKTGSLPPENPVLEEGGIKLFTDEKNAAAWRKAAGADKSRRRIFAGSSQSHWRRGLFRRAGIHPDECRS